MAIKINRPFVWLILLLIFLSGTWSICSTTISPGNLLPNSSFEGQQTTNQWGQSFKDWGGWVYDKPARMAIGTIARTGNFSQEIVADQGGKVRLISSTMKLEPGRYKVQLYLRGLDVGRGVDKNPVDFSVGFDNRFPGINLKGTFGWTPVSYVFAIDRPIENFKLLVGLVRSGWLWIDDVSLTRVDNNEPLTKDPVVGAEEQPFAPAGSFPAAGPRCPECGFHIPAKTEKCAACGHTGAKKILGLPPAKVLADFEEGKSAPFRGGAMNGKHPVQGRFSLESKELLSMVQPQDWTGYDTFRFDVQNPADDPMPVYIEIRDKQTKDYWSRVNYETVVPPGKSTVTLPADIYVGEKSRPGRPLLKDQITHLFINPKGKQLFFDNFRLERLNTDEVTFSGLAAFDFGPADSPVMPGFSQVTAAMMYEPMRGFGWEKADLWRSFNALQPDPLFQDFICPRSGLFRVDLPNGDYHVIMNIDSPGGYWGEVQAYDKRRVFANGKTIVNETLDLDKFKQRYFRNAHREDLPGLDTFAEYVQPMFGIQEFDITVTDGRLELKFEGQGFAIALSSLVIYPSEKAEQGRKFWSWVTERRRAQFNDYFRQVIPKKTGAAAPDNSYRLFSRHFMKSVNAYDGPAAGEEIPPGGLAVTAARGEEVPLTFSMQPSGDRGGVDLELSELTSADTHLEKHHVLPASAVVPGWVDYRVSRVTMDGAVYTVVPRYWHPVPAPAAPGVTRTFWLRVTPPEGAAAGTYRGVMTVRPRKGQPQQVPLAITVLPFKLDPIIDVAAGPWGASIYLPWLGNDRKTAGWNWQMFDKSLVVLKETGVSSFSGVPHLKVSGKNGKISLDTTLADREMALIRAKGFSQLLSAYGANISGYQMYGAGGGEDANAARAAGFPDALSYLTALYKAIDDHAVANNWLPVAWNLCDEPVGGDIKQAVANALTHRKAAEGLKLTTFMGATSMTGNNPKDPHYDLVKALLLPSLNLHDEGSLQVVREAGNGFSFYNGGNRWTFGRYMKMLKVRHNLALRLTWHFNVAVGDPYYALDCREDDYSWYNTDADKTMVPSLQLLAQIMPGLNDYRYLSTLQRLLAEKRNSPAAPAAQKTFDAMVALTPGKDREGHKDPASFEADRRSIAEAIGSLLTR